VQNRMRIFALILGSALIALPLASSASIVLGELQQDGDGNTSFAGNDSEAAVLAALGLVVEEIAKVDWPDTSTDGLTLSDISFNSDTPPEPIAGQWDYAGPEIIDLIVVKAGNEWAAYLFTDTITNDMPNIGLWDTSELGDKGMSHITGYRIVPEPGTVALMSLGLLGLAVQGRRRG